MIIYLMQKKFDEIQTSFVIKALNKLEIKRNYLNIIKVIYGKSSKGGWYDGNITCNLVYTTELYT